MMLSLSSFFVALEFDVLWIYFSEPAISPPEQAYFDLRNDFIFRLFTAFWPSFWLLTLVMGLLFCDKTVKPRTVCFDCSYGLLYLRFLEGPFSESGLLEWRDGGLISTVLANSCSSLGFIKASFAPFLLRKCSLGSILRFGCCSWTIYIDLYTLSGLWKLMKAALSAALLLILDPS